MHDELIQDKTIDMVLADITPEDRPEEKINKPVQAKSASFSVSSAINTTVSKQLTQALRKLKE